MNRWFWLDTTYACGAVVANEEGVIVDACPIYRRFRGLPLNRVIIELRKRGRFRAWKELPTERPPSA